MTTETKTARTTDRPASPASVNLRLDRARLAQMLADLLALEAEGERVQLAIATMEDEIDELNEDVYEREAAELAEPEDDDDQAAPCPAEPIRRGAAEPFKLGLLSLGFGFLALTSLLSRKRS